MARFPLWPSGMQGDGCHWPLDLLEELSGAGGAAGDRVANPFPKVCINHDGVQNKTEDE